MGAKDIDRYRDKHEKLMRVLEVACKMAEKRSLDDLLRFLLEKGAGALSCERTTIFLLDKSRGEIWSKVALGEGKVIRVKEGTGIAGATISGNKLINISDAYKDSRFNRDVDLMTGFRTRAVISVPMSDKQGDVFGCLQAVNKVGGEVFDVEDVDFARAFASQSAVAIESAKLHDENARMIKKLVDTQAGLRERINQIQMIRVIEQAANESRSLTGFMELFTSNLCRSLETAGCSVLIEWNQGKWLYYLCTRKGGYREITLDSSTAYNKLCDDTSASIDHQAPEKFDFGDLDAFHEIEVKKRACLSFGFQKITSQGESLERKGVLQVFNDESRDFIRKNNSVLEILSATLTAIINKKLLEETQEQSNRLATIGELSGTIFHDFKNPMASIRGIAELIEISVGRMPEEKTIRFSKIIRKQVDRCIGMIDELLCFTRGETNLYLSEGSLKALLLEVEEILNIETDRSPVELKVDKVDDLRFKFDKDRLMRVIFNLTNNALEVMEDGGCLEIKGWFDADSRRVMLSVTDTGPGIPDHISESLFEVFVTHGKKNGTGLGLNIARQIIAAHGGQIYLDKDYKGGARFVISLPSEPSGEI